jgi:hypothetical protein
LPHNVTEILGCAILPKDKKMLRRIYGWKREEAIGG